MLLERPGNQRPENVQGMIAARLDRLSAQEKELLQDAAVIGRVSGSERSEASAGRSKTACTRSSARSS